MNRQVSQVESDIKKITIIGSVFDLLLGVSKIIIGKMSLSHSLFVDGLHSLSDLATDFFVLFINSISHKAPDEDHPYGHDKYETLGTLFLGGVLFATAGAFFYENIIQLFSPYQKLKITKLTYSVTIASILIKEVLFHKTMFVAKKHNSALLKANAWHSRSDSITSVIVLLGLVLSSFDIPYIDNIAAVLVSLMIGKMAFDFIKVSFLELADTGLDESELSLIRETVRNVDGVLKFHNLRTRSMGEKVFMDINIEVETYITVSEGHQIASWVAKELIGSYKSIVDVTVHIDVEDDIPNQVTKEYNSYSENLLPLRKDILIELHKTKINKDIFTESKKLRLHYIDNKISLDFYFDEKYLDLYDSKRKEQFAELLSQLIWFDHLHFYFER